MSSTNGIATITSYCVLVLFRRCLWLRWSLRYGYSPTVLLFATIGFRQFLSVGTGAAVYPRGDLGGDCSYLVVLLDLRLGFGVADIAETRLFAVSHDGECSSYMEFGGITRS